MGSKWTCGQGGLKGRLWMRTDGLPQAPAPTADVPAGLSRADLSAFLSKEALAQCPGCNPQPCSHFVMIVIVVLSVMVQGGRGIAIWGNRLPA